MITKPLLTSPQFRRQSGPCRTTGPQGKPSRAVRQTAALLVSPSRRFFEKLRGGPLTFGKMIESLRLSDEMSQVELAKKMGMSKAHLCDIEKDRRTVSLQVAARFAKVMGYDVSHFISVALEDELHKAGLKLRVSLKAA